MKKIIILILTSILLSSCSGDSEESTKIKSMQKNDKKLSCKEILLEMNEAEFYKKMAYKNRGPKLKNVLMPLGYISTYMSSDEATDAAEARVSYLDRIYEIMQCGDKERVKNFGEDEGLPSFK